jgi:hypothetical protein
MNFSIDSTNAEHVDNIGQKKIAYKPVIGRNGPPLLFVVKHGADRGNFSVAWI